jgi:hypothetical protein
LPAGVTAFYYGDARRGVRYARVQPWLLYLDPPAKAHPPQWLAALATAVLFATLATGTATATTGATAATDDPAVISEWNEIAVTTLLGDTTKQLVEDFLYLGFVQAAVYDAVVGVEGRYEPYRFHAHAPRGTSAQAAAAAAAHKVLVTYVPSAQASLDAAYAASLAKLPDGKAKRPAASPLGSGPPST